MSTVDSAERRGLTLSQRLRRDVYLFIGLLLFFLAPLLVVPLYAVGLLDFSNNLLSIGDIIVLVLSAFLAAGLAFISIHFSGVTLSEFYSFRKTGILRADAEFGLRQWEKDQFFAQLVRGARREIVLCGSSLSGWFKNNDHIRELISRLAEGVPITLLFLSPRSSNFSDRESSEREDATHQLSKRLADSLICLRNHFAELEPHISAGKLKICFYNNEPISLIIFDNKVYWFAYLPTVKNRASPNLELERGGIFAEKICEPVYRLINACETDSGMIRSIDLLNELLEILQAPKT